MIAAVPIGAFVTAKDLAVGIVQGVVIRHRDSTHVDVLGESGRIYVCTTLRAAIVPDENLMGDTLPWIRGVRAALGVLPPVTGTLDGGR